MWEFQTERASGLRCVPFLIGKPGIGKTAVVHQFQALLNEGLAPVDQWDMYHLRLNQLDPTDLKGAPMFVTENGYSVTKFAGPGRFPYLGYPQSAQGRKIIIFGDELPQARPSIQNLFANLIDGVVGDYILDPTRTYIICAGNDRASQAATFDIPRNVADRVTWLQVESNWGAWEAWASANQVNPAVVGFLTQFQQYLSEDVPSTGEPFCTPRSWTHLAHSLDHTEGLEETDMLALFSGIIGERVAPTFVRFLVERPVGFDLDTLMRGELKTPLNSLEQVYVVLVEAAYRVREWFLEGPPEPEGDRIRPLDNLVRWLYSKDTDPAFRTIFFRHLPLETKEQLNSLVFSLPQMEASKRELLRCGTPEQRPNARG